MVDPSSEQLEIAEAILGSSSEEITLSGLAGTGKTTLSHYLYHRWTKAGERVIVLGPTGKSAMVLRSKGVPATTIHSAIYHFKGKFETIKGDIELIFKGNNKGRFCDRLIIDEASMITCRIRDDIRSHDIPRLFVGDHGQLKPVKSKPNGLLTNADYKLETIHRQAADSPIIQYAYRVRNGAPLTSRHSGIHHIRTDGTPIDVAGKMLDKSIDRLVVRLNAQRYAVNKSYRTLLGRKQIVEVGEKIICLLNNHRMNVVNGEIFTVTHIYDTNRDYTRVSVTSDDTGVQYRFCCLNDQFGNVDLIDTDDQELVLCDYAYAITCHKAQGSSWRHVAVAARGAEDFDDAREWCYTGVTRAESELTIFC